MSGTEDESLATLSKSRRWHVSPVWLIPLAAALIGLWLVYQNVGSQGPTVTLKMQSAVGIKAGKTSVKVRNVPVGHVSDVRLAGDHRSAVATVQMNAGTADLLGDKSLFWVVKPRIGPQGISGLSTIISGAYIQLRPGAAPSGKRRFEIAQNAPVTLPNQAGISIELASQGDNTLAVGDPVVYQGQNVGKIESAKFSVARRQMLYRVFVHQPYAALVTDATQFWLRSGVDFHLGSGGVDVRIGSLQSVFAGGVTFALPEGVKAGAKASDGDRFTLYATHRAAVQDRYEEKIRYVILFDNSVRGLKAGAPVEYRGLRAGTVEKVPFHGQNFFKKSKLLNFKIPVLIAIEPQRPSLSWTHWSRKQFRREYRRFFKHGLRASIKSSNLLAGTKFVNLSFNKTASASRRKFIGHYEIFPSRPSQFNSIQKQLASLTHKLNSIDIDKLGHNLQHTVIAANAALGQLRKLAANTNALVEKPSTRQLPAQIHDTLAQARKTLEGFQQGSSTYRQLHESLTRLNQVLKNAAPLTRTLRNHPNSLVFGRPKNNDPEPRAPR